jgi:hypothetical protein
MDVSGSPIYTKAKRWILAPEASSPLNSLNSSSLPPASLVRSAHIYG